MEHLPANPQQQDAASQRQTYDGEKLGRDQREEDTQHDRRADPGEDHFPPLFLRHAGGGHPDDDGVVAGQDKIDGDDLPKYYKLRPDA